MTTEPSEREEAPERLKQIRERRSEAAKRAWMDHPPQPTWKDIGFLLSLLDSQAADGDLSHCALCEDPNFIYRDCALAAATRMRERCVEKVRDLAAEKGVRNFGRMTLTVHEVADALMSLTLDGEKEQS